MNYFDSESDLIDNLKAKPLEDSFHSRSNSYSSQRNRSAIPSVSSIHSRTLSLSVTKEKKRHVVKKETLDSAITQDTIDSSTPKNEEKVSSEEDTLIYEPSTSEEIRFKYLSKLIYKGVWNPQRKRKPLNTIIILDWDDTLLCTSSLIGPSNQLNEEVFTTLSEKQKDLLKKLENKVYTLLSLSISKGDTYIITNAEPGWVEYTSNLFYPSVCELFSRIKLISARGEYAQYYPENVRMWKIAAFKNIVRNYDNEVITNIMCVGDSFLEIEAGKTLAKNFVNNVIKTVKLNRNPKMEDLNIQLGLVIDKFDYIVSTPKNWTIKVNKRKQSINVNK